MNKKEYEIMFNIEENYWWYVGLRQLVFSYIDGRSNKLNFKILDAGCGTGGVSTELKAFKPYAIDYSEEAIRYSKSRKIDNIARASISCMPFKNCSFDIVISLDVLYHKNVRNDFETLKEIHRVMNQNGVLLLNLPAYNFLRSRHDEAVHTKHRYTIRDLKGKVEKAGFEIEKITYRNAFLFPIAVARRIIEKVFFINKENAESELKPLSSLTNFLFTRLLFFENKLIRSGINFPFGLSLYCVARKK